MGSNLNLDLITGQVEKEMRELLSEKLVSVILYGSYARGDYDEESDIDIMVLADLPQEEQRPYREKINELSSRLSLENDITVSIKLKDGNTVIRYKDSVPFYANVLNDGVVINARI